ncbi:MAG TPA: co-chaperone DjlA [Steroidobacteraceae bacterium]|nr:co-chaperone DjlA [Steroidobacteraceae bacterium]
MRWTGKVVGALLGYVAWKGPAGAVLGAVIGHSFDAWQEQAAHRPAGGTDADPAAIRSLLFETAFAVMGYLAKADGRVSEAEIGAARTIMRQMHLDAEHVDRAIEAFNRGKLPGYPIEAELARLRSVCGPRHDLLRVFLEIEVRAALAGNDLEGPVRALLVGVAERLGFSGLEVAQLEAALRLQQGRGWTAEPPAPGARLQSAYEVLGIQASASDEDVKKAYRRQMNENHPDKLVARGLPESMQDVAKEKTQRIREAYEAICEHRGLR